MKEQQDYLRDIAEIRSMMERSSKFLSLSGWAGVMAGIYALSGAGIAYVVLDFNPGTAAYIPAVNGNTTSGWLYTILLAFLVLVLSLGTAIALSRKKARSNGEIIWNGTAKRMVSGMAVPLATGGILALVCIANGMAGLLAPVTLVFYGLALYSAGNYTYADMKYLGLIQVVLGLAAACYIPAGLLLWALGFGLMHIVYGIYIHYKYER